jgi:hypothetical protein
MQSVGLSRAVNRSSVRAIRGRSRSRDTGFMTAIAGLPREGRIMRQVRRAFVAHSGQPLRTRDLLDWAFPAQPRRHWHYWSIYRAAPRYAVRVGRAWEPI